MTTSGRRGVRSGLALLGAGLLVGGLPATAGAQAIAPAAERPDDALSRNLRLLAQNPNSVTALMGAGRAALDLGDPEAAITFFARAEKQAPRDGRIKMWIGSAMVQLQQPRAALRFFKEASDLGAAEAEVARERGLAYDISGDPRAAQRDYRLVLQGGRDPEVTRRLALSLAISGQREPALQLLEEQLLTGDRAAERARAMVLALTGDVAGADRAVRSSTSDAQASAMHPYLARLRTLSLADRALAVHLGVFSGASGGGGAAHAASDFASSVVAATEAGRPDDNRASLARPTPAPVPPASEARRLPAQATATPIATKPVRIASATPPPQSAATRAPPHRGTVSSRSDWSWARGDLGGTVRREPAPNPKPADPKPSATGAESPRETPPPASPPPVPVEIAASRAAPEIAPPPSGVISTPADAIGAGAPAVPGESGAAATRLADLAASLAEIDEKPVRPPRPVAGKPGAASVRSTSAAAKPSAPAKKPAVPAEPSRIWVQIAGGADKSALPREFARLKAKAPKAFAARGAWTTPLNATNRLLVGPFPNAQAAQAFVNQLKAASLGGFAWTSAAGQKIEKLPAK
ncbi:MAG TPA: SPOR domain-containing protein [Allosphingosinicella sp.]|nr:SPOR domain-containing protein [Allosphingosinicella sp.]